VAPTVGFELAIPSFQQPLGYSGNRRH